MGHVVGASLPSLTWSVNLRISASQPLNVAYLDVEVSISNLPFSIQILLLVCYNGLEKPYLLYQKKKMWNLPKPYLLYR